MYNLFVNNFGTLFHQKFNHADVSRLCSTMQYRFSLVILSKKSKISNSAPINGPHSTKIMSMNCFSSLPEEKNLHSAHIKILQLEADLPQLHKTSPKKKKRGSMYLFIYVSTSTHTMGDFFFVRSKISKFA